MKTTSFAQRLEIGDQLPDIELGNVINHGSATLNPAALKKKLIILDFWATTCYACIDEFPRLDSLQKKYGDQIQIIAINPESKDSIFRYFKRFKNFQIPAIPFITGDTILSKRFPHHGVPYHVWVDSTKKINFTTFGWNANAKALEQYLQGRKLELTRIRHTDSSYIETPFKSTIADNAVFYSLLSRSVPGVSVSNGIEISGPNNYPYRITLNSAPIITLFMEAYSEGGRYNFEAGNTILFKNIRPEDLMIPADVALLDEWKKNSSYNYDLRIPPDGDINIYRCMQEDLNRYFDIKATVVKNKVDCWVIVRTSNKDKLRSKGKVSKYIHQGVHRDSLFYYHNLPMKEFVDHLQALTAYRKIPFPIVDETAYKGNADIGLSQYIDKKMTLEALRKDLKKYDLDIIQKKVAVPTLVLRRK